MWVKNLQVVDYRNYLTGEVEFALGPNVLVGSNGQGKTNLVEAVGYLATLSSHRVSSDALLIRNGADRAVVRGVVVNDGRELLIELEITAGRANRARLNRAPVTRTRDVVGILRTVLFAPEDLGLVRGDPGDRRRFLDELLVTRTPRYAAARQDYDRVLKQRNALLKTAGFARRAGKEGDLRTLEVWDGHLALAGAELLVGRLQLVADLRPHLEESYRQVSAAAETVGMTYRASASAADEPDAEGAVQWSAGEVPTVPEAEAVLMSALDRVRKAEVERGITLVGPHRDELVLTIDGQLAKGYASHGQSWSIALALRLASYELLRAEGSEPVLILDDVFAELDVRRREHLAKLAASAEQSLITAAVGADVPEILGARRFTVTKGEISAATGGPDAP